MGVILTTHDTWDDPTSKVIWLGSWFLELIFEYDASSWKITIRIDLFGSTLQTQKEVPFTDSRNFLGKNRCSPWRNITPRKTGGLFRWIGSKLALVGQGGGLWNIAQENRSCSINLPSILSFPKNSCKFLRFFKLGGFNDMFKISFICFSKTTRVTEF